MTAFDEYVEQYGLHFNKKLYEWAVKKMRDRNGGKIQPMDKEQFSRWMRERGVVLKNDKGYDAPYVLAMAQADYLGSSIADDAHLVLFVQDYMEDPDGTSTKAFDHFVVDCKAKDEPIFWSEYL